MAHTPRAPANGLHASTVRRHRRAGRAAVATPVTITCTTTIMSRRFLVAGALAATLLAPAALRAQVSPGTTFAASGGLTAPVGDLGDGAETGYHAQLTLAGRAPMMGGSTFRIDGLYAGMGGKDGGADVKLWSVNLNIVFTAAMDRGGVRPYVLGGVGYYNTKLDAGIAESEARNSVGFNGGGGLEFDLGQGLGAFLEVRYHHVLDAFERPLLLGSEKSAAQFVPVTIGLRF